MLFSVKPEAAAGAFQTLRALRAHPHTTGYFAVKRALGPLGLGYEPTVGATVKTFSMTISKSGTLR